MLLQLHYLTYVTLEAFLFQDFKAFFVLKYNQINSLQPAVQTEKMCVH